MSDIVANAEASTPLTQVERVVDTFIAPAKTFHDILRSASGWLPWCRTRLPFSSASARYPTPS